VRSGPEGLGAVKKEERSVLERTGRKVYGEDGAAALLGVPPTTLQSKIKRLGLASN
jgi:transcriptional regulator with GAF, ATPase, and Fis domain